MMDEQMKAMTELATTVQERMRKVSSYDNFPICELGNITGTMGLKLDSFPIEIPVGGYMVCRTLALKNSQTASAGDPSHTHEINTIAIIPPLKSGDRVLVAYASGKPVVIDVVI